MKFSIAIVVHHPDAGQLSRTFGALDRALVEGLARWPSGTQVCVSVRDNTPAGARLPQAQRGQLAARVSCCAVEWVLLDGNRGFGHAHNGVLPGLDSDFHLVLNPDVELDPPALAAGIAFLQGHADVVLVMPKARDEHGAPQFLGKRYPSVWVLFLRAFAPRWLQRLQQARLDAYEARDLQAGSEPVGGIPIASGCCMLLRTAAFRALGGFDERYFLYFEDFDLSLRLATLGRLVYLPAMGVVHHGGEAARKGLQHILWFATSAARFFSRFGWRWC